MADVRRPFPTDSELGARWQQHQPLFDRLIVMARVDSELVRIAPDFTWTRNSVAWPRAASDLGFSAFKGTVMFPTVRAVGRSLSAIR